MYEWIFVLMEYIDRMVCREFRDLRSMRVKQVLRVAADIEGRVRPEYLRIGEEISSAETG